MNSTVSNFLCSADVDECVNSPCKNGATCVNNDGGYTCQCDAGWTGKQCEQGTSNYQCYKINYLDGKITVIKIKSIQAISVYKSISLLHLCGVKHWTFHSLK